MFTSAQVTKFQEAVWRYYRDFGRSMPWREPEPDGTYNAYKIVVSEVMLQQTQAARVVPKYSAFLEHFPSLEVLAEASLHDVLLAWQGLGYNRRARYLRQIARQINEQHSGKIPDTLPELVALPGIGHNTAAAILAYAFNQPHAFVETNIRSVYLHHFFKDKPGITDKQILEQVTQTLDQKNPREWYWALMDYGVFIKQTVGNPNTLSKQYTKQTKFHGSARQIRGVVLRILAAGPQETEQLRKTIDDSRLDAILDQLIKEQLIEKAGKSVRIAD